jgi:hypothetical protein
MARHRTCRRAEPADSRALAHLAREEAAFRLCRRALSKGRPVAITRGPGDLRQ